MTSPSELKLVFISDTHCQHEKLEIPQCDILIHSGDACGFGRLPEFASFAAWFEKQTQAKHRIYVPGNHDRITQSDPSLCKSMLPTSHMLLSETVDLEGLRIFGTPYTPEFCNWAWQGDDDGSSRYPPLSWFYERMHENTDIVVCHGPYFGTADLTYRGEAAGSHSMCKVLRKVQPKIFACGHIHQAYGVYPGNEYAKLTLNAALSFEYEDGRVDMKAPIVAYLTPDGKVSRE